MGRVIMIALAVLVFAAACDDAGFSTPEEVEVGTSYLVDDLTLSKPIPAFGHQIDYPSGWATSANPDSLNLAEEAADLEQPFPPPSGLRVRIQSVDAASLSEAGLDPSAGLEGFLAFNAEIFGWSEPLDPTSITVGDAPALLIRVTDPEGPVSLAIVMGEIDERFYMLGLEAPSDDHVDAFWPVWESMLASVRPS